MSASADTSSSTKSANKRKKKEKSSAPIEWPAFLTALHELQDDDANQWPFDLEMQSEFTDADETDATLRAWTGAASCGDWPIRLFATDGSGALFGLYKDAVVCLGSEGGLGAFGDLATFALLLAHRVEPAAWLVDSVDDAARRGYGEIDVDDVPLLSRNKSPAFDAIADLVKTHFDIDSRALKLRAVLDRVAAPVSLRQFGQFVKSRLVHGGNADKKTTTKNNDDDDE
jgi:hypothetical protein